ncbi:hypothetical protein Tco_0805184 [Tanacetum coccineum]
MGYEPETYRSDLLKYLDILDKFIDKSVLKYGELRMKENEVNAIKKTGKQLNEEILHKLEIEKSFKLHSENALSKSVNETQMHMQEGKVDMGKALDAGLVVTESSETKSEKQDTSSRSGNYITHVVDADIKPLRMTKVIKGEFEKLEDLKVKGVSLTCDTSLEVFNNEFNRLSGIDDDLFTYEVEVANMKCCVSLSTLVMQVTLYTEILTMQVLKMVDLIYVPGVDSHQLRMKVFPLSLADNAKERWISEGDGKITTWEELVEKLFCRFYPESYDGEDEMLDEGEN